MNYVITYWLPPDSSAERRKSLREYFDLQRLTKRRFGCNQTIVTNIDYDDAIPFLEPKDFRPEHAILAKWFGLGQMIDTGMNFPITMHDHDVFLRSEIKADPTRVRYSYGSDSYMSDQILIIPECCGPFIMSYIEKIRKLTFKAALCFDYGCKERHEGRWSSESIQVNMGHPLKDCPKLHGIALKDVVSFHIKGQHSLDAGNSDCDAIAPDIEAIHCHINKGRATAALHRWLDNNGE